ncbi:MAG TPA: LacI family DNA-binding transcriptional regulator [Candidatus Limnocylindrales bacterium]|nr:LacI family DNA-binding transcriptional regulator [Candidatus Limnocylindrales bacterium]
MSVESGNGRGATLDEVARVAGVSRATVSRVVNGNPKVGADAKRQVERAIERLGYVPNQAARSLVTRRSQSIGLVIPEPAGRLFEDPFFPRLLRGIGAALSSRELQLVLLMPQSSSEETRAERYLTAGHVDGALLVSLHGNDPLPQAVAGRGVPVVVGGRPPRGSQVSYVDVDNVQGARSAVEHLIGTGRKAIATIAGPQDMPAGQDRLTGYHDALESAGIARDARLVADGDFTQQGGAEAARRILAARPNLDAIFAASDLMAAGAIQVLRAAGRGIPEDVAVVGFDDSQSAETTDPPLTSVRQPIEEMGREMVRLLVEQLAEPGSVPRTVILATQLVRRRSSEGVQRR